MPAPLMFFIEPGGVTDVEPLDCGAEIGLVSFDYQVVMLVSRQ
jgi:hypothetical protein